jgi:hypothetical protein
MLIYIYFKPVGISKLVILAKKKIIFNCLKLKLEKYSRIPYLKYRHFFNKYVTITQHTSFIQKVKEL